MMPDRTQPRSDGRMDGVSIRSGSRRPSRVTFRTVVALWVGCFLSLPLVVDHVLVHLLWWAVVVAVLAGLAYRRVPVTPTVRPRSGEPER